MKKAASVDAAFSFSRLRGAYFFGALRKSRITWAWSEV